VKRPPRLRWRSRTSKASGVFAPRYWSKAASRACATPISSTVRPALCVSPPAVGCLDARRHRTLHPFAASRGATSCGHLVAWGDGSSGRLCRKPRCLAESRITCGLKSGPTRPFQGSGAGGLGVAETVLRLLILGFPAHVRCRLEVPCSCLRERPMPSIGE
jgi:hypothetical protein